MPTKSLCNWLGLIVLFAPGGTAYAGEEPAIDPTWLEKARAGINGVCEKYETLALRLEGEHEMRSKRLEGSRGTMPFRPATRWERIVRFNDNTLKEGVRTFDDAPNKPDIRLECDNGDYHFDLGKTKSDAPYLLTDYAAGKRKYPLIPQGGLDLYAFSHLQHALSALENKEKFILRALRMNDANKLLRIEFNSAMGKSSLEEQLDVNPNHDWRLVGRRVETSTLVARDRWGYGIVVGGLEFPTECKGFTTYKVAKAPPNMDITDRLISLKITDKKPEDFRLSAFDLPEPIDAPPLPKPTRWYLWILAAAGGSAAIAFGFAYLRRRSQARGTLTTAPGAKP